jgi:hypothetical protein
MPENNNNWKTKTLILGAVVGALIGLGTSYLLTRTAEESGGQPPKITTGDAIKVLLGIIGVVRGIAALGDRK